MALAYTHTRFEYRRICPGATVFWGERFGENGRRGCLHVTAGLSLCDRVGSKNANKQRIFGSIEKTASIIHAHANTQRLCVNTDQLLQPLRQTGQKKFGDKQTDRDLLDYNRIVL